MPENYPQFFTSAKGVRMTGVDGRDYIDYMCAYGLNLFGYGDEEINEAFVRQMRKTDTLTGVSPVMVELAERFTGIVSHADWAVFVKNGTDATTLGAMIARAHTKREKIIIAEGAYHGMSAWSSASPGVTAGERAGRISCIYNDVESLERAVAEAGDDLAAIFATPFKHDVFTDQAEPDAVYARRARELCDRTGALLVVDDVRAGFKLARDCSWATVGIEPDLSAWGKCIANGHPISALLGNDKARKAATEVRYTGSFWFQSGPMAAGLVTLGRIMNTPYLENIQSLGRALRNGMAAAGREARRRAAPDRAGDDADVPVRRRSGSAQRLPLVLRDGRARRLHAPVPQHVHLERPDYGRRRADAGSRRRSVRGAGRRGTGVAAEYPPGGIDGLTRS